VELKLMKDDQQYSTLINQSILEGSGQEDAIDDEYGVCFTKTLGELLSEGLIVRDDTGTISETEGLCAPRNLSFNNPKYGDLVFRWRLSKMKPNIIDQLSGLAGDQQEGVAE
jgi:hypothetical protein